jgi:hypothetical protein
MLRAMSNHPISPAVIGALVAGAIYIGWDAYKKHQDAQPILQYTKAVRYENGQTILTYRNISPTAPVAITGASFVVADEKTLGRINRHDPRPKNPVPCGASASSTGNNSRVEITFDEGFWCGDGKYKFPLSIGKHIEANDVGDVHLKIVNPKWAGETFTGRLELYYSGDPPDMTKTSALKNVTIYPQRRR